MPDDVMEMVRAISRAVGDDGLELSEWEQDFLDSISLRAQSGQPLSEKQDAVLERLWKKATGL